MLLTVARWPPIGIDSFSSMLLEPLPSCVILEMSSPDSGFATSVGTAFGVLRAEGASAAGARFAGTAGLEVLVGVRVAMVSSPGSGCPAGAAVSRAAEALGQHAMATAVADGELRLAELVHHRARTMQAPARMTSAPLRLQAHDAAPRIGILRAVQLDLPVDLGAVGTVPCTTSGS